MKWYILFKIRTIFFILIIITTNIFLIDSTSAHSFTCEGETVSEESHSGITAKDWDQIIMKASNIDAYDNFGVSAAISGDTIVVGAPFEDSDGSSQADDSVSGSGAAYVFVRDGTTWSQQAYLKASNVGTGDKFGYAVSISGDTIVVGAYSEDGNGSSQADDSASGSGAAYVFVRDGTIWTQQDYLKASTVGAEDYFGLSLAISGDTIVVGAPYEDSDGSSQADDSASGSGAAYVFVRDGTTWSQQAYLKASNVGTGDTFGYAVSISGDTIAIGAKDEDGNGSSEGNNSAFNAGAAYIFGREGTNWSQQAYLKASNVDASDHFGYSVGISGDTIVVGAPYEDSDGTNQGDNSADATGAAYVFVREGTTWSQTAYLKASNVGAEDEFGFSVAISGDTIVVGAPYEDSDGTNQGDNSADAAGAAYVFVRDGTAWTQQAYLKASNVDADDRFGWSIAVSRNTIVVGAHYEDSDGSNPEDNSAINAGAAYVFSKVLLNYCPLIMR